MDNPFFLVLPHLNFRVSESCLSSPGTTADVGNIRELNLTNNLAKPSESKLIFPIS